jgi:hypothetical protein
MAALAPESKSALVLYGRAALWHGTGRAVTTEERMAKNKKSGKGKAVPKSVGGVKIPKRVRKVGSAAAKLADHPVISDIIAAGLLAAAAALTETKGGKRAIKGAGDEMEDAAEAASRQAGRVKRAVKAAGGAMGDRILEEVKGAVASVGKGKGRKKSGG